MLANTSEQPTVADPSRYLEGYARESLGRLNNNIHQAWCKKIEMDPDQIELMEKEALTILASRELLKDVTDFYRLVHLRKCHEIACNVQKKFFDFVNASSDDQKEKAKELMYILTDDQEGLWAIPRIYKKGAPYKSPVPIKSLKDLAGFIIQLLIVVKHELGIASDKMLPAYNSTDQNAPAISKVIERDNLYLFYGTFKETLMAIEGMVRLIEENIMRRKTAKLLGVKESWEEDRDRFIP